MIDVYNYQNYKEFLNDKLDDLDQGGRGARARLSRAINCQTAYTAQVLRGDSHYSLEQGESINDFFGHTDDQGYFFLLTLQLARAGTAKLKTRFQKQIQEIQKNRRFLKNKLEAHEALPQVDQITYYSSWLYGAVHTLASIPEHQSLEKIAERLGIEVRRVNDILNFLIESHILEQSKNGEIKIGKNRLHLGSDSHLIIRHHLNWRLQSMQAIEKNPQEGIHYSSVISISKKDFENMQSVLVETLKGLKSTIQKSPPEEVYSLCLDFYPL